MKLGFDLDKIFIDFPPFIPVNLIYRVAKRRDNGILEYRIPKRPEQLLRLLLHNPSLRRPIKKNLIFLKNIANEKNELYLISSRFGFLKKRTDELILHHALDSIFKEMYFNFHDKQPHHFKHDILEKLNLDKYVDDDVSLLKYLARHNKQTSFYWLNPRTKGQLTRNLFAITDLSDMV